MASPEERSSRPNLRLHLVGLLVLALFGVLALRLWTLQVINTKSYAAAVTYNALRTATIPAPRGDIVDRNDTILAGNTTQEEIVLSRAEATQHPSSIGQVAALVGETPAEIRTALDDKEYSPYEPVPVLDPAPAATVQYLEQHQSQYPGVSVQTVTERDYPEGGSVATPVLGYVGPITQSQLKLAQKQYPQAGYNLNSQVGEAGLEEEYDHDLKGRDGTEHLEVNAQGNVVGTLRKTQPKEGDTLVTNIDLGLQNEVNAALEQDIMADRATGVPAPSGAAVVLNAQTGAVEALASYPTYDLNEWVGGISEANYHALLSQCPSGAAGADAPCALDNYAIEGLYTPGSTFKLITATAALQDGLINPSTTIDDTGSYNFPDCTASATNTCSLAGDIAGGLGPIDVATALAQSDDVFFYNLGGEFYTGGSQYGSTPIQNIAADYGLTQPTGIDLPGESTPRVDSLAERQYLCKLAPSGYSCPASWYIGDQVEMAFGQGETVVTPIALADAYATFANGGTRYQPQIAAAVVSPSGKVVKTFAPKVTGHVSYSPANYAALLQGFEGAVEDGTEAGTFAADAKFSLSQFRIAGKTGTADVGPGQQPNALFVGFGPIPNPKYVVVAVVSEAGYGAQAAAPAVMNIFNYLVTNPVGPVQLPTATHQPSTIAPATNPPAGATPPTTTTTTAP
jgi:penicillin-binding protein 2